MRNSKVYLLPLLLFTALTATLVGSGCRKENGIDNNSVIRTPYGVYFSDRNGALYGTNDGKAYKTVFPADGYSARSVLCTSGENILWVKNNLHVSEDNGLNFNPPRVSTNFINPPAGFRWSSIMLDVPKFGRVYAINSNSGSGVVSSQDNGVTWANDEPIFSGVAVQSFTQLKNGNVYAIDNTGTLIYEKTAQLSPWSAVTVNTPLPTGSYHLSHINNALVAADVTGGNGIYFSNNGGADWVQYTGMPTNQEIFAVNAPFEQVLLAGCDSAGIFRLNGNTFVPSNNGLAPFTKVYGIVGKQDMYKNDKIIQYVYIATNNGLFRSEDLGQNWTLVRAGDFRAIY